MNMGRTIAPIIFALLAAVGPASAEHDAGLGKSQDGKGQVGSVAVAPEPSTFWLFAAGSAVVGFAVRRRMREKSKADTQAD